MKPLYKMAAGILSLVCICVLSAGCSKDDDDTETIGTTELGLTYNDLTNEVKYGTAYVIRSNIEYYKYVYAMQPCAAILIPYDGYAIIVAKGSTISDIHKVESELVKRDGRYVLRVNVYSPDRVTTGFVLKLWATSLRVENFPENADVRLEVKTIPSK